MKKIIGKFEVLDGIIFLQRDFYFCFWQAFKPKSYKGDLTD